MTASDYRIFRTLYDLALRNPGMAKRQGQIFRMAAAISDKRGNILATGVNQVKSHPIMMRSNASYHKRQIYLHAEADALRKLLSPLRSSWSSSSSSSSTSSRRRAGAPTTTAYLAKCRIHVLRLKRSNSSAGEAAWMLGNARPCAGCMDLIHASGIREIFWTRDCEIDDCLDTSDCGDRRRVFIFCKQ